MRRTAQASRCVGFLGLLPLRAVPVTSAYNLLDPVTNSLNNRCRLLLRSPWVCSGMSGAPHSKRGDPPVLASSAPCHRGLLVLYPERLQGEHRQKDPGNKAAPAGRWQMRTLREQKAKLEFPSLPVPRLPGPLDRHLHIAQVPGGPSMQNAVDVFIDYLVLAIAHGHCLLGAWGLRDLGCKYTFNNYMEQSMEKQSNERSAYTHPCPVLGSGNHDPQSGWLTTPRHTPGRSGKSPPLQAVEEGPPGIRKASGSWGWENSATIMPDPPPARSTEISKTMELRSQA